MECDLADTGPSEKVRGWTRYKCRRSGCPVVNHSPYDITRQVTECIGWPYWWEFGNWVELFLAAAFITPRGWAAAVSWLGLTKASKCESCEERKQKLNTLGERMAKWKLN